MSTALHQSVVHFLAGQRPTNAAQAARVQIAINAERLRCRREAQPGDGCTSADCPHAARCPGREMQQ